MKINRLLKTSSKDKASMQFPLGEGLPATGVRGANFDGVTKVPQVDRGQKISLALADCFAEEVAGSFRLEDEFSVELIDEVVNECRSKITENTMGKEDWENLRAYLVDCLWEFSRLKEDLVMTERKRGMVQQKASLASRPVEGKVNKHRVMACAMLLAEVEMRCDHLRERISLSVDAFVKRILVDLEGVAGYDAMELRLRAVFGAL